MAARADGVADSREQARAVLHEPGALVVRNSRRAREAFLQKKPWELWRVRCDPWAIHCESYKECFEVAGMAELEVMLAERLA